MVMMAGWSLTGRLLAKHFGGMGDSIARMIASFDPETATEADRDALAAKVRQVAETFATAERDFQREHGDVVKLREQIAQDENVAAGLAARLEAKEIDEATVAMFCDELEAAKARLPQEVQEESDAKAFMDEIKAILDDLTGRLTQFDAEAAKARRELQQAEARMATQQVRSEQAAELASFKGATPSTAMAALRQRAESLTAKAEGMRIVTDIANKPAEDRAKIDALRASVLSGGGKASSVLDRVRALAAAPQRVKETSAA